jgi:hypothetical protein
MTVVIMLGLAGAGAAVELLSLSVFRPVLLALGCFVAPEAAPYAVVD